MLRSVLIFLCAATLFAVSCGHDEVPGPGDDSQKAPKESLAFVPAAPLQLDPGASAVLAVQISPPRSTTVLFGIIGDPKNEAFLSAESAQADAQGTAYISLTGPKTPGSFRVRAAVERGPTAERTVSVSGQGFGTLLVTPNYSGTRNPQEWVASAWPDFLCSSLVPDYPIGPTSSRGASPLSLGPLPVGPSLSIVVRSGNLAAGCLDVPAVSSDSVKPITVNVTDLPVVSASALAVEMVLSTVDNAFLAELRSAVETRLDEADDQEMEADLLLDAFKASLPKSERDSFESDRKDRLFSATTLEFLGPDGRLRQVFRSHLVQAATSLDDDPVVLGTFDPRAEHPDLIVTEAARVPAEDCGFESDGPWALTTDADRSFVLSGDLVFGPVPWLAGIARARAADVGSPLSSLLARDFDCAKLVSLLTPEGEELYPGCGIDCSAQVCEAALERVWRSWIETDEARTTLSVAASGAVESGASGVLLKLNGRWIGSFEGDGSVANGDFTASAP